MQPKSNIWTANFQTLAKTWQKNNKCLGTKKTAQKIEETRTQSQKESHKLKEETGNQQSTKRPKYYVEFATTHDQDKTILLLKQCLDHWN